MTISIRIMWSEKKERKEAEKILRQIERVLSKGYSIKTSNLYDNRKNKGGRYYITITGRKQIRKITIEN